MPPPPPRHTWAEKKSCSVIRGFRRGRNFFIGVLPLPLPCLLMPLWNPIQFIECGSKNRFFRPERVQIAWSITPLTNFVREEVVQEWFIITLLWLKRGLVFERFYQNIRCMYRNRHNYQRLFIKMQWSLNMTLLITHSL